MGSDETAITIPGGPRVIDVFYGNGAPSGPNCTLFSGADRLPDSLRDRSEVGWSPTPHAGEHGAPQRALDRDLGGLGLWPDVWLRELLDMYLPMRMRCSCLRTSSTILKRPPGGLRATD